MLDDITLYWVTNTAISAARFYWESTKFNLYNAVNVSIPAAVTVFPGENYQVPRSWPERAYHKVIQRGRTRADTTRPGNNRRSSPLRCEPLSDQSRHNR